MLYKAVVSFSRGKLLHPLDKTESLSNRNSRSVSASAVPHGGHSSQRSGVGTDSDPITSQNDTSTPSERTSHRSRLTTSRHEYSTISSSDPEFSMILRREVQNLCERNKNYIDPAFITRDSNSSHSPNTSGSKDNTLKQEYVQYVEEPGVQGFYYPNNYYYPSAPMYQDYPTIQQSQYARGWQQNIPYQEQQVYNWRAETEQRQDLAAQPQIMQRREEIKKLDPSAPAYEQKRKQKPAKKEEPVVYSTKEEKKEVRQVQPSHPEKAKPARKPLGNAAENTIRQIINRKKKQAKAKAKPKDEIQAEIEKEMKLRRAKSREYTTNNKAEVEGDEIESDVYTQEDIVINTKKKEDKKKAKPLKIKKTNGHVQNIVPTKARDNPSSAGKF